MNPCWVLVKKLSDREKMKISKIYFIVTLILYGTVAESYPEENSINLITDNIMKVCDKPENAGSYWDINVKGDGNADIKLRLGNVGLTTEVGFSKVEWDGIRRTVEDNIDYRSCVKALSPVFIEKFSPLVNVKKSETNSTAQRRVLGGIKWQEIGRGVKITLSSCYRRSASIFCEFIANSMDSDSDIRLYESSAIYDQNGNKYAPSKISVANFVSDFRYSKIENVNGELVLGVDTKIVATFNGVDEESMLVSKAMLVSKVGESGRKPEDHVFSFRDVKIELN